MGNKKTLARIEGAHRELARRSKQLAHELARLHPETITPLRFAEHRNEYLAFLEGLEQSALHTAEFVADLTRADDEHHSQSGYRLGAKD